MAETHVSSIGPADRGVRPGAPAEAGRRLQAEAPAAASAGGAAFEAALAAAGVRLSAHAEKRLAAREIHLGLPEVQRLTEAVNRAQQKGGRDSLILMDDLAFILDVRQRTIVTALDSHSRKEGVFTNIDTVVLAK